jgi:hypothetical protein
VALACADAASAVEVPELEALAALCGDLDAKQLARVAPAPASRSLIEVAPAAPGGTARRSI